MLSATPTPASVVALAEVLPIGILLATGEGAIGYANPALTSLFAAPPDGTPTPGAGPGETLADLCVRAPYAPAAGLWRAPDDRRERCTLPGGRILEGVWHPLAGARCLAVTDVTSDALVRRRLREHNRALAELVATKTELVSALLHEVRTPLTAARSMAAMLPGAAGDPVAQALERNLGRLDEVTREIATISGIENGTRDLRTVAVDLDRLLGEVAASLDPPATVVSGAAAGRPFRGDPGLLAEVFERLILAVRAVAGGDRIEAGVRDGQWRLRLRLPPDAPTDRLFTSTAGHGNATALMFARAVLGRHDGSVGVEDENLTVRLPLR